METQSNSMATKKIPSLIRTLALPSIVAQIVNILYNIAVCRADGRTGGHYSRTDRCESDGHGKPG